MSSLALLIGADPKVSKGGPVVRLQAGQYIFHVEGQLDSELTFHAIERSAQTESGNISNGAPYTAPQSTDVRVTFSKRGTESHINVFAERVL